ncbi:MAG TPA: antibiotic biosynthesis monooxygenase family protein [Egicoccus sp.]|nr:antibiotic biosynthesis monooxygenase family protein [Egicoccus sp.]HSK22745.1 antibiotic biosynthesis monooxygenase family protein [Egicoccus sp.]
MDDPVAGGATPGSYVSVSELRVGAEGRDGLVAAFRGRLGAVESWPGFVDLQVWQDRADADRFVMVTWWRDEAAFRAYLASDAFARSSERIPRGPDGPRRTGLQRFEVVAW